MPTLADVQRQIAAYPDRYIFWTSKEIRALPEVLDPKESVKAITSGMFNNSTWLAVCTERRLIFLNCGMFIGVQQVQMPLDRVQSIDHAFTIFFGAIRVFDGLNSFTMTMVKKSAILPFLKVVQDAMYQLSHGKKTSEAEPTDVASQLAKLAGLKEKGYLTEEEFQAQKKKLLG